MKLAVYGKGGVGKTTISVNLSMCLALQNSYFSVIHYQNRGRSGNKLCLTYKLNYSKIP